jgi:DNA-binding MarR family transcriptional regulator
MAAEEGGRLPGTVATVLALERAHALLARRLGRALAPWRMSWAQALSLMVLAEQEEPMPATRLVERLGLGRTAMTSVVDRLERRGWVVRRPSSADRRVTEVLLSAEGRAAVAAVRPALEAAAAAAFAPLGLDELRAWQAAVERLAAAARAALAAQSPEARR